MSEEEIKGILDEEMNEESVTAETADTENVNEEFTLGEDESVEAEVSPEEQLAENTDEYKSQFSELMDEENPLSQADEEAEEEKIKKGSARPLIITAAIVVLLAVIGVALYFVAFAPTINGTWKASEGDNTYITISDDKFIVESGDEYTYSYSEQDCDKVKGKDVFYITSSGNIMKYKYTADGNMFTGRNATITMENSFGTAVDTQLESVSEKNIPELKPVKDFKENKKLTGTWTNEEIGYTYAFSKDGILTSSAAQSGNSEFKCAYSVKGSKISIRLAKEETSDMEMKIDGDKLTLSNNGQDVTFTKVKQ